MKTGKFIEAYENSSACVERITAEINEFWEEHTVEEVSRNGALMSHIAALENDLSDVAGDYSGHDKTDELFNQ